MRDSCILNFMNMSWTVESSDWSIIFESHFLRLLRFVDKISLHLLGVYCCDD